MSSPLLNPRVQIIVERRLLVLEATGAAGAIIFANYSLQEPHRSNHMTNEANYGEKQAAELWEIRKSVAKSTSPSYTRRLRR